MPTITMIRPERVVHFCICDEASARRFPRDERQSISVETDTWPIKQAIAAATLRRVPARAAGEGAAGEAAAAAGGAGGGSGGER